MGLAVSQERPIRDDLVVRASIVSQPGATKGHRYFPLRMSDKVSPNLFPIRCFECEATYCHVQ